MFGIAWSEILLICAVALVVIGPKDIPKVMYEIGRVVRRLQYVKFAFSRQFEDFLKEHDLDEMRHGVNFEAPKMTGIPPEENDEALVPKDGHE